MTEDASILPRILLVEDNPDDVELTRIAMEEAGLRCELLAVEDGADAIDVLRSSTEAGGPEKPHLVLLDLNLPKVDGRDVLRFIKGDPQLRSIPVLILTTSGDDHDIRFSYDNHASAFLVKPIDYDEFVHLFEVVVAYWFGVVVLPPTRDPYDPYV